ncbi:hypothetical protein BDV96DRAFT_592379 [Lophiotrema nucula]|uniref:Uncharacterized protein n=1 Tax=Lophiotrema nucula TaxID=690887 RepID=A0A6A5YH64_9PLEO|nr:hypothetical protein BDV96DRAFT_592379 [Lophiotrema nucula]
MLQGKKWKIHKEYLKRNGAHRGVACQDVARETHQSFVCDHIIIHLLELLDADIQGQLQELEKRRTVCVEWLQENRELLLQIESRLPGSGSDTDLDNEDNTTPSRSPSPYEPDWDEFNATSRLPAISVMLEHARDELNVDIAAWSSEAVKFRFAQEDILRSRLAHMPKAIECPPNDRWGEVTVSWTFSDPTIMMNTQVAITLHAIRCNKEPDTSANNPKNYRLRCIDDEVKFCGCLKCRCPYKYQHTGSTSVTFTGLDLGRIYFPKVAHDEMRAFFALHPKPVAPGRIKEEGVHIKDEEVHIEQEEIEPEIRRMRS